MLWTNQDSTSGNFLDQVEVEVNRSNDITITSGYVSLDIINKFSSNFEKIAQNGGMAKLLVGMAFYEGLNANKLTRLIDLNSVLEKTKTGSGVFVSYNGRYHGKLYRFSSDKTLNYYVGSSNFSRSGLSGNIECTVQVQDDFTKTKLNAFLEDLFLPENAVSIQNAEIVVPGSSEYSKRISLKTLDDLPRYDSSSINKDLLPKIEYPLNRVADKEKSNLNVYFGKGRWSRLSGKILPRPWYEVELIANKEITSNPLYPKGNFEAFTDDGYIMQMYTGGDYFKNIRSKGKLTILGQWIKGKLQKSGALLPLTPVTQDTLDQYGQKSIKLYKMSDNKYYLEF